MARTTNEDVIMPDADETAETTAAGAHPTKKRRRLVRGLVLGGALAVAAGGAIAVGAIGNAKPAEAAEAAEDETDAEEASVPVEVTEASRHDLTAALVATANLVPKDQVNVLSESEGRIARVAVEEGDWVREGDVLVVLDRREAEIAHGTAALKAESAELAYDRAVAASAEGLISSEQLDAARTEHEVAQQSLAEAQWRLDKTTVRAPFTGRVTARTATVGQHVRPGDALYELASWNPLIAEIFLPERDVMALQVGGEATLRLASATDVSFAGQIERISPVVDTATGTVKVTVHAVRPPSEVRPGAFVAVEIPRDRREGVIAVPRDAVIRQLRQAHVFVTAEDGTAARREVHLGLEQGGLVEVTEGLDAGDIVVVAGQGALKDGAKVKILTS